MGWDGMGGSWGLLECRRGRGCSSSGCRESEENELGAVMSQKVDASQVSLLQHLR